MSTLDHKQTLPHIRAISALPPTADIDWTSRQSADARPASRARAEPTGCEWRQPGSMPRLLNAEPASGVVRNLTRVLAASASLALTMMPLENTVVCCTSAEAGRHNPRRENFQAR